MPSCIASAQVTLSLVRISIIPTQVHILLKRRFQIGAGASASRPLYVGVFLLISLTVMPIFYDTHAHLDYPDFAEELPAVIAQAHAAGIAKIISIGTDLESSKRAIRLAERFSNVFAV